MKNPIIHGPKLAHDPSGGAPARVASEDQRRRVPEFDIQRILYDTNSTFNPLHQESLFECQPAGVLDGRVLLNIALPCDMTRFFLAFMESMTGFFRIMDLKARSAAAQADCVDPVAIAARNDSKRKYVEQVCSVFDDFIASGHSLNDAVKRTNLALKTQNHPWATYSLVSSVLRSEGKLRKNKRLIPGKDGY